MNFGLRKEAESAKYYAALNLLKSDLDGTNESIKKVQVAYRQLMAHAHADKGGSTQWATQVNKAKQCLMDSK